MENMHNVNITTRDRVLRAWENSMELVRDYQEYSHIIDDDDSVKELFSDYAQTEAEHASVLLEHLHEIEERNSSSCEIKF